jgi:hypothetical protein
MMTDAGRRDIRPSTRSAVRLCAVAASRAPDWRVPAALDSAKVARTRCKLPLGLQHHLARRLSQDPDTRCATGSVN